MRRRIEIAGGDPTAVRVVAVTKGFGPNAVSAAAAAGVSDIGENYARELLAKAEHLAEGPVEATTQTTKTEGTADRAGVGIRWHFLGAVQRNKVKALAPVVDCWQSVARVVEGEEIARRRPGAAVLVQVDTSGDARRNGCVPSDVPALVSTLGSLGLDVRGLMTVAPQGPGPAAQTFETVRGLADRLGLPERSMGMTDDLEDAVAHGTTMVRIGRALFGERPSRAHEVSRSEPAG